MSKPLTDLLAAKRSHQAGLVALVRTDHDVELHPTEERFLEGTWTFQGRAPLACEDCQSRLYVYRRAYESGGKVYRYWGIVCANCSTVNGLDVYDNDTKRIFRSWDALLES